MKLLSIAVPSYNSEAYMEHCVQSLLFGGDEVEILIVDDGSKDHTGEIADRLEVEHPGIVRAIHQENGGHGEAVNTGLRNATGMFFKVVDSDDWVNEQSYQKILDLLRKVAEEHLELDMLLSNFVYEKEGVKKKKVMRYTQALPVDTFFGWDDIKDFQIGKYILMHSVIYRTEMLRMCKLELPKHTFYVDNIYVYYPLPFVKTMYYIDTNFYRYYIGREDQSVNEKVMTSRIIQQLRVNKIMFESYDLNTIENKHLRKYMYQYLEIICVISSVLLIKEGSKQNLALKKDLWYFMKHSNRKMYNYLRHGHVLGLASNAPGYMGRKILVIGYKVAQRLYGFN